MKAPFDTQIAYLKKLKLHYISVSEEILKWYRTEKEEGSLYNQRFEITINGQISWRAGSVSLGNNQAYITISKSRMKKLGIDEGDTVSVQLVKDTSKYGMDVPEEFEELLRQDGVARLRFENLSMGTKRAIIYLIAQLKSSQKRIDKSMFLMENLKQAPLGKETMRHILGKEVS